MVTADGKCRTAFYSLLPHTPKRVATTRVCADFSRNPIVFGRRIWYNIQRSEHHRVLAKARCQPSNGTATVERESGCARKGNWVPEPPVLNEDWWLEVSPGGALLVVLWTDKENEKRKEKR